MLTMFLLAALVMVTILTSCIGGGYLLAAFTGFPLWVSTCIWVIVYGVIVWLVLFFISTYDSMEG